MKILAIVVSYNPSFELLETIKKVKKQVHKLIIIDNNSQNKEVFNLLKKDSDIETIENLENIGLAAAQNIGIKKAVSEKYEWILFLDDDSDIEENFIEKLKEGYLSCENKKELGMIVPNILFKDLQKRRVAYPIKKDFFIKRITFNKQEYIDKIMFAISSGSLIKVEMIKKIGFFIEEFFIDHIDVEYCLRANTEGYTIRAVKDARLYQKVGNTSYKKIGVFRFYPTNHNPKRQYTKFRNAIWTWKNYIFKEPKYIVYDILLMTNHMIRVLIFEENKKENLKNILKGIKDGLFRN